MLGATPVSFGNGQTGLLRITQVASNRISGVLEVNDAGTSIGKGTIAFLIPSGSYSFTGTLTPPRSYNVAGDANGIAFSIKGLLPTATLTGTYQIAIAGQSASGILPKGSIALPKA